jgi:hypothetical protein
MPSAMSRRTAWVMVACVRPVASASSTRLTVVRSRMRSSTTASVDIRVSEPNDLNTTS